MKPKKKPARFVAESAWVWDRNQEDDVAAFRSSHPHPVAAARAEARRLNAWWERKRRVKR